MYQIRQKLYTTVTKENVTWNQACLKVPLIPSKYSDFLDSQEEATEDPFFDSDSDEDFDFQFQDIKTDFSVDYYPDLYCHIFNR